MNPLKKLYCRVYQIALRVALPVLPYRNPKVLGSLMDIPDVLVRAGIDSVLLVTDKQVRSLGLTLGLEEALRLQGVACAVYEDTVANPTTANVRAAVALFKAQECDAFIAFGGGSAMDCAKAAGAQLARPNKSLKQMEGILKVNRKIPLLIAVPTTAGTGSETTLAAVITDENTRHKYPINDFPLIPSYAVLDPDVTATLPKSLAATTGMDALTHAVEAFIGRSTTRETRADAIKATKLIFHNLETACTENTEEARRNMLQAAHLAGRAFTRSYVGYIHAVAHSLGGRYNTPHGLANAVLMPIVLKMYGETIYPKLAILTREAGLAGKDTPDAAAGQAFIKAIEDLNRKLGIPDKLAGIKVEDIPHLAKTAEKEGNPLYPVPVLWDAAQLEKIYEKAAQ